MKFIILFQPVNLFPPTDLGFHDVMGNVWEWAEDQFNGLPGFKTVPLYDDFSGPCFDGQHNMIMVIMQEYRISLFLANNIL